MSKSKKIVSIILAVAAIAFCLTFGLTAFASSAETTIAAPKNVKVQMSASSNTISWSSVKGATNYSVYRISYDDILDGNDMTMIGNATKSPYVDKSIQSGQDYMYSVVAKKNDVTSDYSDLAFATKKQLQIAYYTSPADINSKTYKLSNTTYGSLFTMKNDYYYHTQNFNTTSLFSPKNAKFFGLTRTGYELDYWNLMFTDANKGTSIDTGIDYSVKDKISAFQVYSDIVNFIAESTTEYSMKHGDDPFLDNIKVTFSAHWSPITYKISYTLNGGSFASEKDSTYKSASYTYAKNPTSATYNTTPVGCTIERFYIEHPTKPGYSFKGWTITGLDNSKHFCRNGSSDYYFNDTSVNLGSIPSNLNIFRDLRASAGTVKFIANWEPITYTITYKYADGSVISSIPAQNYTLAKSANFAKLPVLTGYKIAGWYSDAACTVKAAKPSAKNYGNMTVYAKKTPLTYKINYKWADSGSSISKITPASYTYGTGATLPTVPTVDYYKVTGWFSDKECTKSITSIPATQTGAVTVYAKKTAYYVRTAILGNNATLTPEFADKYILASNTWLNYIGTTNHHYEYFYSNASRKLYFPTDFGIVKSHNTFVGWMLCYYHSTGSSTTVLRTNKIYKAGSTLNVKTLSKDLMKYVAEHPENTSNANTDLTKGNVPVVLLAQWKPDNYKISYYWGENCGADSKKVIPNMYPNKYDYGTTESFAALPTIAGYTVTGWFTDAACTTKASALSSTSATNYVLYAKKTPINYKITYYYVTPEGNSVAYTKLTPTSYTTDKETLLAKPTVPSGYKALLNGKWYTNPACTSSTATKVYKGTTGDKTYYTKVSQEYTITYKWSDGETIKGLEPSKYVTGQSKTLAKVPTSSLYTTDGWFTDAACTKRAGNINGADFGNKVFYAKTGDVGQKVNVEYNDSTGLTVESYDVGQTVQIKSLSSKTGYTTEGWYTGNDVKVTSIDTSKAGTIRLYAKYTPYTYTVHFFVDGVENTSLKKTVAYDETFTMPNYKNGNFLTTLWYPTRNATTFAISGSPSYAQGKTGVKNLTATNNGNVNLYCKTYMNVRWSFGQSPVTAISPYSVKQVSSTSNYYLHKTSGSSTSQVKSPLQKETGMQKKDIYSTGSIPIDTKEGYTFAGWNTKTNGTGIAFVNDGTTNVITFDSVKSLVDANGYLTVYAQFVPNTVTINLRKNNSEWTTSKTESFSMKLVNKTDTTKEYPFTIEDGTSSFTVSGIPNGTYVIYMPLTKGGNIASSESFFNTVTINNNSVTKDLDFYSVTVNKGTGISSVAGGIGWIVKGGSRNISKTLTSGYTWVNWTGTKDGVAITPSTSDVYAVSKIQNEWVLTANAKK